MEAIFTDEGINFGGLIAGTALLVIIWAGRAACIKGEYYFTKKLWVLFLIIGLLSIAVSLFVNSLILSSVLSILGFTFLWGIHEIIEQEERVKKGWFPRRKKNNHDV